MTTRDDRTAAFHDLHVAGCFVMPNPVSTFQGLPNVDALLS